MAQPPSDDRQLLRQLLRGKAAAFDILYERHQQDIYRFAWHMSGNDATAQEITQEVFLQMIRNPKAYDPQRGPMRAYLMGITRNLVRRRLEQARGDVALPEEAEEWMETGMAGAADICDQLDRQELLDSLHKAVRALPEQYREVIVLCEMEEMSYLEAAEALQCAPGTVASRLNRARKMLRARLTRQGCAR
jgi:RNA polymerase sigma-70 factor, ECF subfamily